MTASALIAKNTTFAILVLGLMIFAACTDKKTEGVIVYQLQYQLPDSLRAYADYLPKEATVYFKGDSAVSIQQSGQESTTVITYKPTNFMQVLLKSPTKHYVINYSKSDQDEERANMPIYTFKKGKATKTIAGYNARQYTLNDKMTGENTEAWFTSGLTIPQNSLTTVFDASLGVPLIFSTNQNGIITKTTVKSIRFEAVPAGVFIAPKGYGQLTPQQLKDMPVEN